MVPSLRNGQDHHAGHIIWTRQATLDSINFRFLIYSTQRAVTQAPLERLFDQRRSFCIYATGEMIKTGKRIRKPGPSSSPKSVAAGVGYVWLIPSGLGRQMTNDICTALKQPCYGILPKVFYPRL